MQLGIYPNADKGAIFNFHHLLQFHVVTVARPSYTVQQRKRNFTHKKTLVGEGLKKLSTLGSEDQ
jgi:hypothetical protein